MSLMFMLLRKIKENIKEERTEMILTSDQQTKLLENRTRIDDY